VHGESVIIALFGTALGLGLGVLLGWSMVKAMSSEVSIHTLTIPVGTLATITAIAAFAGVAAALMPARRAARIDVLKALSAS
jgi:putative ABC transport system permease protein